MYHLQDYGHFKASSWEKLPLPNSNCCSEPFSHAAIELAALAAFSKSISVARTRMAVGTGYKWVRFFTLPADTVRRIWLPPRLSAISCFLPRLLCLVNSFLQRLSMWFSFLPRVSAGSKIARTISAGSHFSWTVVSAGSKRSRTTSAEAKYDGQSLQEAKISGLVYTLWLARQVSAVHVLSNIALIHGCSTHAAGMSRSDVRMLQYNQKIGQTCIYTICYIV